VITELSGTNETRRPRPAIKVVEGVVGYGVGAAGLAWLFHGLPLDQFGQSVARVKWMMLVPCVLLSLAAYLCVAWEWQLLLRPVGPFRFWKSVQAVLAGRFANDALPLHVGYIVRAFLASRWMRVSVAATVPSLIMERLWDGVWLAAGTGLLSLAIPLPQDVARARNFLATTVFGGAAAVALVVFLNRRSPPRAGPGARLHSVIRGLADGTRDIVKSHVFPMVLVLSLVKLVVQAAAILLLLPACGIKLSVAAGLGVFVAGYLATCAPSTPAGAGLFQVFVVGVLGFFGVGMAAAAGFSLISFVTLTAPPAVAGFFALGQSGMTLRQIRDQAGRPK
jgi:hypothetical protein